MGGEIWFSLIKMKLLKLRFVIKKKYVSQIWVELESIFAAPLYSEISCR